MTTRTRMTPAQRREGLIDHGIGMFAATSYDEVRMEGVAEQAGVSRALLYHYFPNKRDFFVAVMARVEDELLADTEPDSHLPPLDQIRGGVEAYLRHVARHHHGARAVLRESIGVDPAVVAAVSRTLEIQVGRVLGALGVSEPDALLIVAIRGWLNLVRAASQDELTGSQTTLDDVRDLCMGALIGMVVNLPDHAVPKHVRAQLRSA